MLGTHPEPRNPGPGTEGPWTTTMSSSESLRPFDPWLSAHPTPCLFYIGCRCTYRLPGGPNFAVLLVQGPATLGPSDPLLVLSHRSNTGKLEYICTQMAYWVPCQIGRSWEAASLTRQPPTSFLSNEDPVGCLGMLLVRR